MSSAARVERPLGGQRPASPLLPALAAGRGLVADEAFSQRLLVTGGTLYLAVVRNGPSAIDLLRYVP